MNRRSVLRGVAVMIGVTSGCFSGRNDTTEQTSSVPPETHVEVPPCPEKPDTLTEASVADFVETFEVAYVKRTVLAENERVTNVEFLEMSDPEVVDKHESRFVVHFRASYTYGYKQSAGAEDTVTGDSGWYNASYLVGPRTTKRATAYESHPDPAVEGTEVSCPP